MLFITLGRMHPNLIREVEGRIRFGNYNLVFTHCQQLIGSMLFVGGLSEFRAKYLIEALLSVN